MTSWPRLRAFVRRLRGRAQWERALDDELRTYVEQQMDDRIRRGMAPAEARRTALAHLGGMEQVDASGGSRTQAGAWLDTIGQDLRSAFARSSFPAATQRGSSEASLSGWRHSRRPRAAECVLLLPFGGVTDQKRLVRVSVNRNCGRPDCWTRMVNSADYEALREGLTGLQDSRPTR